MGRPLAAIDWVLFGGDVTTSKSRQIKIFTPTGKVVTLEVTEETRTRGVRDELVKYEKTTSLGISI